jgi:hypothetical protein
LMLVLLYTFARSESPLAKANSGEGEFDLEKHLAKQDVQFVVVEKLPSVRFRLKEIKQDPLGQRAAAQGEGDWVVVASTAPDAYDIVMWTRLYFSFMHNRPGAVTLSSSRGEGRASPGRMVTRLWRVESFGRAHQV